MKAKRMGITEILRRIWLFSENKIKSFESFSKQPTQLIVELNSSLRRIIVPKIVRLCCQKSPCPSSQPLHANSRPQERPWRLRKSKKKAQAWHEGLCRKTKTEKKYLQSQSRLIQPQRPRPRPEAEQVAVYLGQDHVISTGHQVTNLVLNFE